MEEDVFREFTFGDLMEHFSLGEIRKIAKHDFRTRASFVEKNYMDRINELTSSKFGEATPNHAGYWGYLFEYVYSQVRKHGLTEADYKSAHN